MIAEPSDDFTNLRGPIYRYGAALVVVIHLPITISDDIKYGGISATIAEGKAMIELALLLLLACVLIPALLYFLRNQLRARLDSEITRSTPAPLSPEDYRNRQEFSPFDKKLIGVLDVTESIIPWIDNVLPLVFGIWAFSQGAPLLSYLFTKLFASITSNH